MNSALWIFTETRSIGDIVANDHSAQFGMYGGTPLAGDFDGDGHLDLATANAGTIEKPGNTVSVLLSPRLDPLQDGPELASFFPDWESWPDTAPDGAPREDRV